MTPNRWAAVAAVALILAGCCIGGTWALRWYNRQLPPEQRLTHLEPAPSDRGWITPSQPASTTGATP